MAGAARMAPALVAAFRKRLRVKAGMAEFSLGTSGIDMGTSCTRLLAMLLETLPTAPEHLPTVDGEDQRTMRERAAEVNAHSGGRTAISG